MIQFLLIVAFFVYTFRHDKKHPPSKREEKRYKKYLETGNFEYLS